MRNLKYKKGQTFLLVLVGIFILIIAIFFINQFKFKYQIEKYQIGYCVKSTEGENVRIYAKNPSDRGRWCIKYPSGDTNCNFGKLLDGSYPLIVPQKWCQDDGI